MDGLEDEFRGDFSIIRVNIDTARGKKLAREHSFIGQPTFILFDGSGQEVRRLMGPQDPEMMGREIKRILGQ